MPSQTIIDLLNKQINLEFYSSNLYLQMSAWAANQGLTGTADFLKDHATEELEHMQRLFDYVLESGAMPLVGAVEAPQSDYHSVREVFEIILAHEKDITTSINDIVATTFESKDFSTFNFLQWFVAEQHEEENLFQGIIDTINLFGDESKSLYFIDKEIAKLATETPASVVDNSE